MICTGHSEHVQPEHSIGRRFLGESIHTIVQRLVQCDSNERPWIKTERGIHQESPRQPSEAVPHDVGGKRKQNLVGKGLRIFLPEILVHPLCKD